MHRDEHAAESLPAAGMRVIDATGVVIGTVDAVEADGVGGRAAGDRTPTGMIERAVEAVTGPHSERTAMSDGHLRVDAREVLGQVVYVPAGQVAGVDRDVVTLALSLDDLPSRL